MSIGRASGIVIATGTETEFGVIFSMMQDVRISLYVSIILNNRSLGRGKADPATT